MAVADAVERMGQFREWGRIGEARPAAPVVRLETTPRIVRGDSAIIAWETARVGELNLSLNIPGQPALQNRVAARGQRSLRELPVGRTTVLLRALPVGARGNRGIIERRAVIEVVYPPPAIEISAPRRVALSETIHISWSVGEAQRAVLSGPDGERCIELEDSAEFVAHECGRIPYTLRAFGRGGAEERRVTVHVIAPALVIEAPKHILAGFGRNVIVPYNVTGAAKLLLRSPDRREPDRLIPMRGKISMDGATGSERIVLVATCHDGKIKTHTVAIEVAAAPSLHSLLNRRN